MNFFDWQFAREILPRLLDASLTTIGIALAGFAIAVVLGLFLAIARRSRQRWLSWPITGLIEFIRSTPLLIQVYFLFYVFPNYGLNLSAMQAGIIGIALHYACYTAEVYRAGLDAVPRSQWEAVTALNMKPWTAYRDVILPQALRPVLPALGNYLISILKDTPVLSAITVVEIMQRAKNIGSESFRYLEPITMVGVFFLILSLGLAWCVRRLENRMELAR
ncbi:MULTISPECIES: ectoine/hydroxyectoine ABC transporter permease subunit EhuD [Stutzerimonas]|jgi:polar amino acid transport system permease protein|uniref:Ectoine/hydroxyectoine ABC transporter permease subunit EhuD n=1 Tax=Stutzerimonas frequens TaxID=2968969 RepID=A0AA47HZ10_9GAMM|nr:MULTISPECIES: ectoine/hydroxyectoine ABC transporter permease subunit EhuD [Stutzerimonas]MAL91829.1 ectoine/hydroxyectoine ABC transporter permease subunit EhuD [Pseudomonas sp.]MCX4195175.1 ectoine/hydroxyectoine ABC transporter permease subunit EhuD [Methylobacterium organophilum]MEC7472142.1 ectoine/hydroxyectoine ABC transporter permease subunit EhuD [Pseudomonadota bacterium]MBA4726533.1 ectoine/hydroxyectoine ABC transporter permease subunit EhuD [Pseudomonas sp.]MBK3919013.1 ectoine|tara:strand:+ start:11982 stop:12641 length:660 start_codon:yes stop_codon:yes gene_type:complete